MLRLSRPIARLLPLVVTLAVAAPSALAQTEEGIVDKYYAIGKDEKVWDSVPELKLEDLRRITRFSELKITAKKCTVGDRKYMRSVTVRRQDNVLEVVGDRYRFYTPKNGAYEFRNLNEKKAPMREMLWIKYESLEEFGGRPRVKDLFLLPVDRKKGTLLYPWPFSRKASSARHGLEMPMKRYRERMKLPLPHKSVVGVLPVSKRIGYLVVSVYGEFMRWNDRMALEHLALRGKPAANLEAFHDGVKKKGKREWVNRDLRIPNLRWMTSLCAPDQKQVQTLMKVHVDVLKRKRDSVPKKGWEDLLRLEEPNEPVPAIDALIKDKKTFGELVDWAEKYLQGSQQRSDANHWGVELKEQNVGSPPSLVIAVRVARYAFRRAGFPCRLVGFGTRTAAFPVLTVEAYLPQEGVSWVIAPGATKHLISVTSNARLSAYDGLGYNSNGKSSQIFEIPIGGGRAAPPIH